MGTIPHHDGSERHVSTQEPALGEAVTVWLRVPHDDPATTVAVRSVRDGEPHFDAAVVDRRTATETWWRADVVVRNPVTGYRFLLNGQTGKLAGDKPVSGTRIGIAVAVGLAILLVIVLIVMAFASR